MSETQLDTNIEEFEGVGEFVAHIYVLAKPDFALCGLPAEQDIHGQMHLDYEQWFAPVVGRANCPLCGAPACATCLSLA